MRKKQWLVVAPFAVVLFGMLGYVFGEDYGIYAALLSSLNMLRVNLVPTPLNPLLEISRWIGIFFLFSLVYALLVAIIETNRIWHRSRRPDSVAIHGNGVYAEQLANNLGKRAIHSENGLSFDAPRQVIMFESDETTLDYFQTHSKELLRDNKKREKEVFLCLNMGSHISIDQSNVYLINISEVKAISYWREHFFQSKRQKDSCYRVRTIS